MIPTKALEAVTTQELARAATVFTNLKQLRLQHSNIQESILDNAFETHVQGVLEKLDNRLPVLQNEGLRDVEIIMAKHGLFDAAFQQAILLCQTITPPLGESLKDLRSIHSSFLSDLQQLVGNFVRDKIMAEEELASSKIDVNTLVNDKNKLLTALTALNKESEDQNKEILSLRHQLRDTSQQLRDYRDGINIGVGSTSLSKLAGETLVLNTNANAQQNNMSPLSTMSPPNKKPVPLNSSSSRRSPNNLNNNLNNNNKLLKKSQLNNSNDNLSVTSTSRASTLNAGTMMTGGLKTTLFPLLYPENWLFIFRTEVQRATDDGKCRVITLNECKDIIEKIYDSKTIANEKAMKGVGHLPMETMEQHVYRSLEKKYGLRGLAVEQAGKLFLAIEKYEMVDNYIAVFNKIFRNDVEEDFRFVQGELNKSIRDLLMVQLMSKFPTKDSPTLQSLLDNKVTSFITHDEWTDMMNYLYNAIDASAICSILKKLAREEMMEEEEKVAAANKSPMALLIKSEGAGHGLIPTPVATRSLGASTAARKVAIANIKDSKRMGYISPSIHIPTGTANNNYSSSSYSQTNSNSNLNSASKMSLKATNVNAIEPSSMKLSFVVFLKSVLDFQLRAHEEYLHSFVTVFQQIDEDVDGVLTTQEFYKVFKILRQSKQNLSTSSKSFHNNSNNNNISMSQLGPETNDGTVTESNDLETFAIILKMIDPLETDVITFSSAASVLSKLSSNATTSSQIQNK